MWLEQVRPEARQSSVQSAGLERYMADMHNVSVDTTVTKKRFWTSLSAAAAAAALP